MLKPQNYWIVKNNYKNENFCEFNIYVLKCLKSHDWIVSNLILPPFADKFLNLFFLHLLNCTISKMLSDGYKFLSILGIYKVEKLSAF